MERYFVWVGAVNSAIGGFWQRSMIFIFGSVWYIKKL